MESADREFKEIHDMMMAGLRLGKGTWQDDMSRHSKRHILVATSKERPIEIPFDNVVNANESAAGSVTAYIQPNGLVYYSVGLGPDKDTSVLNHRHGVLEAGQLVIYSIDADLFPLPPSGLVAAG